MRSLSSRIIRHMIAASASAPLYHLLDRCNNISKYAGYRRLSKTTASLDINYHMEEGCGIFAMAMSRVKPGGYIYIISRDSGGEQWSRNIPYEITHVVYKLDNKYYDIKGERSLKAIAIDFDMENNYTIKGPWLPKEFYKKFIGNSDNKPLFGTMSDIKKLEADIINHWKP